MEIFKRVVALTVAKEFKTWSRTGIWLLRSQQTRFNSNKGQQLLKVEWKYHREQESKTVLRTSTVMTTNLLMHIEMHLVPLMKTEASVLVVTQTDKPGSWHNPMSHQINLICMRLILRTTEPYLNMLKQQLSPTFIRKATQVKDWVRKVQQDKLLLCVNKKWQTDFHQVEWRTLT